MNNTELTELLNKRYSCRSYQSNDIKDEDIEKVLHAGTLAPSTNNRQPWTFVVVKNKEIKNNISDMLREKGSETNNQAFIKTAQAIFEAPVLLCVFNKEVDDESISIVQSIGACVENMLLIATSLGISSLWIRATSCIEKEIAKKLNKEDEHLMACIALGYAKDQFHEKNRKLVREITTWYN